MTRFALLAASVALMTVQQARAGDDSSPVCARAAVVERVATLLREAGRPMRLDEPVGELSTGTSRLVHCAVRGQMLGYDTNHHGIEPIDASFVVRYTLELRQNGIFLHIE